MPHLKGDPLLCMSANQLRVHKAYGAIPIWLNQTGDLVCVYCNTGAEGCSPSCLMSNAMNNMRADVAFLDAEDARNGIPVTHVEMADNFRCFCFSDEVQNLVNGEHLFLDFVENHRILLVLQGLGPWLKQEADRYAAQGGVHNQAHDRLALKCCRAVAHFLRLELSYLSEEDTIILCNIIESSGVAESQASIQKVLDLLSIVNAVKEMQKRDFSLLLQELENAPLPPLDDHLPSPDADTASAVTDNEPTRCQGLTKAGQRCKLTAESVNRLHGRCAEAAEPLVRGERFCKFHKDQEAFF